MTPAPAGSAECLLEDAFIAKTFFIFLKSAVPTGGYRAAGLIGAPTTESEESDLRFLRGHVGRLEWENGSGFFDFFFFFFFDDFLMTRPPTGRCGRGLMVTHSPRIHCLRTTAEK